jgi:hypothetical protein
MKDSLWSVDMVRCESVTLQTYWVLVVMDQYTRRIIGFGIQAGVVDGVTMLHLSSDHDPLVPISPMGSEPARRDGGANQNSPLGSALAPIRGAVDRYFCCPEQNAERF